MTTWRVGNFNCAHAYDASLVIVGWRQLVFIPNGSMSRLATVGTPTRTLFTIIINRRQWTMDDGHQNGWWRGRMLNETTTRTMRDNAGYNMQQATINQKVTMMTRDYNEDERENDARWQRGLRMTRMTTWDEATDDYSVIWYPFFTTNRGFIKLCLWMT